MHSTARHPRFLVPRRLLHYRHGGSVPRTVSDDAGGIARAPGHAVAPTRDLDASPLASAAGTAGPEATGATRTHDRSAGADGA